MSRQQAALVRFLLVCVAWTVGQMLALGVPLPGADLLVPAALAIGVFIVSDQLGRPRQSGDMKYWRGRRIDDDDRGPRRWN